MLLIIGSLLFLGGAGFNALSGLRAYVGGEGLWAKGQKDASYHLIRYVQSGDEAAYRGFLESLALPLGDQTARLELDAQKPRRDVVVQGFLAGGNHPDDIPTMITLYRLFKGIGHVEKAIGQWAIGDSLIAELSDLGAEIHAAVVTGRLDEEAITNECHARIDALQTSLSEAENQFSRHMGTASRQAAGLLIAVMVTFSIIGGIICFVMLRAIAGIIKELGNSEARFRRLAENAPDVIYRMALPSGDYEYISPAAEPVFGYPPETWYAKPRLIAEIIHPDSRDYFTSQWENLLAGEMPPLYEYQINHRSGESRWLNQRNVLIRDEAGQPIAIEGIVTDVTERKAWEAEREALANELRQAHKMEAIGTLAGGIAHDFNNILFAIMGNAELIKQEVSDNSPAAQCIDEVLLASYRARDLVRHILAFGRGDKEGTVPVRVQDLADEALVLLRASLPATIEIKTHFAPVSGAVLAEPTQIHQVIMNLCTNATQAMEPHGGRLDLTLEEVDLSADDSVPVVKAGRYVRLAVRDTGPGIDPGVKERIFDPYFTTKPMGKGSGMGLAVVHGIVANCGGTITADNEPGGGAVFSVYLPRVEPDEQAHPGPVTTQLTGHERILLVDDEQSLVRMNQKQLEQLGYRVSAVTSGRDALSLFEADPQAFDLVITDQTMPGMTGDQLTGALLAIRPDVPIILCTGYSEILNKERARALGVRAFVTKPIRREDLAAVIRESLDRASGAAEF